MEIFFTLFRKNIWKKTYLFSKNGDPEDRHVSPTSCHANFQKQIIDVPAALYGKFCCEQLF